MYRFIFLMSIVLGFSGCTEKLEDKPDRPNFLFIAVDDLRNELGVYDNSQAITPHLDSLARSGSLFTHHFVQVPTCGASRHALITGMRPYKPIHLSNRAIEVEISGRPETDTPESFFHRFKQEGYRTIGIGKISHSADGLVYGYEEEPSAQRELPHSWSELLFDPGKWKTGWNAFFAYANGENRQSLKKQVKPYEAGETDDNGYPDGLTTQLAVERLKQLKDTDQPFFMAVGLFKPHLPFNAPKKYWDLYNRDSIEVSSNGDLPENIHLASLHESGEFNQYALGEEKAGLDRPVSEAYAKKLRHAYLAAVSYSDAQIGKLLSQLKASGLDKNTVVVVWGDHGWHLGDQRVWGKHTLFENALKSALIIKNPQMEKQAKRIDHIVETVDLYPTLLEMGGLSPRKKLDGTSLVPLLDSSGTDGPEVAYGYYKKGITMRTPEYRLTKYYRKAEPTVELYAHSKHDLENRNIAQEHPEIVAKLMPLLEEGNTGLYHTPQ
ncbi:sulfatase [Pseudozobellia thermophila]|uniref:Arylsulfatase A n=1 Tax=Pseudozobellia thermophila TaxID=192903 RepID=A0A1M6HET1_9FLAO|nr:sulfatase [Pseudozobellia thermophila]SHJ20711.1 Arylsulfatase A [Pseudozobellia thermophila]